MTTAPVTLVTGANRGIGYELVRQLVMLGHQVMLTARDIGKAERAAAELRTTPDSIVAVQLDVTNEHSVRAAAEVVEARFGRVDALVNNAAIDFDRDQPVMQADMSRAGRILDTNVLGVWRVSQVFLPLLLKSDHPRIVNVSSESGKLAGYPDMAPAYSVSKSALNALTIHMAHALKRDRVLVNSICPGWIATDMGGPGGGPVEEGAASILWGVTLPDNGPTGGFFQHGKPLPW
ncbi:MAG: SDR family NAD(P)-dependent oxidoreductase [Bacteroidota bacterium]|nr:SDR family NAD(P)-dependent oxidoreductase [Bacteroidota bacterium]